jgi:hypothetical protein
MPITVSPYVKPYQLKYAYEDVFDDAGDITDLTALYGDYLAAVIAVRPNICPKCSGTGQHLRSIDSGIPADTDLIECTLVTDANACEGYGYTVTAVEAVTAAPTYGDA